MCTVTFIPIKNKVFITTNRDESIFRSEARPPERYTLNNQKMIYPKDGSAGGTWITICENGNAGVLLNGAFKKHQQKENYKKSRGLVLLDIMKSDNPVQFFKDYDFNQIEPLTIIILQNSQLYECRWDEQKAHVNLLDHNLPHIWSSCTLYDAEMQIKRHKNFFNFLKDNPVLTSEQIIRFHKAACFENEMIAIKDKPLQIKTVSITSIELQRLNAFITYHDEVQNKIHTVSMHLRKEVIVQ